MKYLKRGVMVIVLYEGGASAGLLWHSTRMNGDVAGMRLGTSMSSEKTGERGENRCAVALLGVVRYVVSIRCLPYTVAQPFLLPNAGVPPSLSSTFG